MKYISKEELEAGIKLFIIFSSFSYFFWVTVGKHDDDDVKQILPIITLVLGNSIRKQT